MKIENGNFEKTNDDSLPLAVVVYTQPLRGHVQTTWTNEGGGGVAQMTTTLNNSF